MSAYIVVDFTPTNPEKLQEYAASTPATLVPFGGEFLVKGPIDILNGESSHAVKVIIEFPDKEKAKGWYESDAYQKLISLRNEGMDSQFHLIG